MSEQSNKAPPMGRALRILLGVALIVYAVPVYFRLPFGVFFASLVLMVGLFVAYWLIDALISRRVGGFGPFIATILVHVLLVALYVAGFSKAPIIGGGKGQLAAVTFLGVSLVVAGICGIAGCELMAIPDLFRRKEVALACLIFSPFDKLERWLRRTQHD